MESELQRDDPCCDGNVCVCSLTSSLLVLMSQLVVSIFMDQISVDYGMCVSFVKIRMYLLNMFCSMIWHNSVRFKRILCSWFVGIMPNEPIYTYVHVFYSVNVHMEQ